MCKYSAVWRNGSAVATQYYRAPVLACGGNWAARIRSRVGVSRLAFPGMITRDYREFDPVHEPKVRLGRAAGDTA